MSRANTTSQRSGPPPSAEPAVGATQRAEADAQDMLAQSSSRLLYQLIIRQLHHDGFPLAASQVADITGTSVADVNENGDLLSRLVECGWGQWTQQSRAVERHCAEQVVERYISLSKLYAPLGLSQTWSVGRRMFKMGERFSSAVLGGAIRDVTFSPDGTLVSCCGTNGLSLLFSLETAENLVGLDDAKAAGRVRGARGGAAGSPAANSSSAARNVNEYTELAVARRFGDHIESVEFMRFHPTDPLLITGGVDGDLYLREYAHPDSKVLLKVHDTFALRAGAFHPCGDYVMFVTDHPTPRLVNTRSGQVLTPAATAGGVSSEGRPDAVPGATAGLTSIAFSPDGRLFVTSSLDGSWSLNDGVSGRCVFRADDAHGTVPVTSSRFSRTGQVVLTCGMDAVARLWDTRLLGSRVSSASASSSSAGGAGEVMAFGEPTKCEHRSIRAVFSGDESHVLCQDATLFALHNYCIYSGDISCTLTTLPSFMQRGVAASPFSNLVVSGGDDRRLRLWTPTWLPA